MYSKKIEWLDSGLIPQSLMSYYQYIQAQLVPGSLQILVSSFFVFGNLGCITFFKMVSVWKARQERLLKNANKHFCNFVGQDQQKTKSSQVSVVVTRRRFRRMEIKFVNQT